MTPSFIGLMATMLPGVRPSISLASLPTASTRPLTLLTATIEGSLTTMPRPLAYTQVLAVPRSMARSVERNDRSEPRCHVQNRASALARLRRSQCTPFLPESFTWYIAISAARTNSSAEVATSGSVATPTEAVSRRLNPSPARNGCASIRSRTRSPTATAPSAPVSGRMIANSSPPNRATTSVSRADPRITAAASTRARLPARWPWLSLTRLEPVEVQEQQRQRTARARRALGFPSQHLVQVPGVVELRQVVGDRERLGPPQPQRVVERLRRPFERDPEQFGERRRDPWRRGGGGALDHDEGRHRACPAPERPSNRSACRAESRVSCRASAVVSSRPRNSTHRAISSAAGERVVPSPRDASGATCPSRSAANTPHARRFEPLERAGDTTCSPMHGGIERLVRSAHHRQHRLRSAEPALEHALTATQPLGQIDAARTAVSHSTDWTISRGRTARPCYDHGFRGIRAHMTMLDRMRRHKGWLKWSLALVVLTFVVFYIPDFLSTSTGAAPSQVLAEVEGEPDHRRRRSRAATPRR